MYEIVWCAVRCRVCLCVCVCVVYMSMFVVLPHSIQIRIVYPSFFSLLSTSSPLFTPHSGCAIAQTNDILIKPFHATIPSFSLLHSCIYYMATNIYVPCVCAVLCCAWLKESTRTAHNKDGDP